MANDDPKKRMEDDKKILAEQREQRAKDAEERAKKQGKPTPTQVENDLAALGHHPELEADGSAPDPFGFPHRQLQADPASGYATRQMGSPASGPPRPRG
jgi:hypothetical protein